MELIPGLPYDIGLQCLFRVSFDHCPTLALVCRTWKQEILFPEFWKLRKASGFSQPVVVMVQAHPRLIGNSVKCFGSPRYRVTLCDIGTGIWSELPRVPWFPLGLPLFCHVVVVGLNLVVIGGQDPMTWVALKEVSVYNFLSGKWTRGADMPGCQRSFFACASDEDKYVFVAGGCDDDNKALSSAMAYDVASDLWVSLPDMWTKRSECKGVFYGDKFHVIGGYDTEMHAGRFGKSADMYNVSTQKWDPIKKEYLIDAKCPATYFSGGYEKLYMCINGNVTYTETREFNWRCLTQLPVEIQSMVQIVVGQNWLFVIGSSGCGEPHKIYAFDLESHNWQKVDAPMKFEGHVQSCCWLNI